MVNKDLHRWRVQADAGFAVASPGAAEMWRADQDSAGKIAAVKDGPSRDRGAGSRPSGC